MYTGWQRQTKHSRILHGKIVRSMLPRLLYLITVAVFYFGMFSRNRHIGNGFIDVVEIRIYAECTKKTAKYRYYGAY